MTSINWVQLPDNADLLKSETTGMAALIELLEKEGNDPSNFIVCEQTGRTDRGDLLDDFGDTALFDEVRDAASMAYKAAQMLRTSRCTSVFFGRGNCSGLLLELALSCHSRIWDSPRGTIGFPLAAEGLAPLSLMDPKDRSLKAPWRNSAVMSVQSAIEQGVIDGCMRREQIEAMITRIAPETVARIQSPQIPGSALGRVDRGGQIQAHIKLLLSSKGAAAIASHSLPDPSTDRDFKGRDVLLNISHTIPPTGFLVRLLRSNLRILFSGESAPRLSESLGLIYGRLLRAFSQTELNERWNRQVSWSVARSISPRNVELEWLDEERLHINGPAFSLECQLIGSDFDRSSALFLEIPDHERTGEIQRLLEHLQISCFATPASLNLRVSDYMRLLVLREIFRVSGRCGKKLLNVCDQLRRTGWVAIGNDIFWQKFMQHGKILAHPIWKTIIPANKLPLVSGWSELTRLAETSASPSPLSSWHPIQTSNHFAAFGSYLLLNQILPYLARTGSRVTARQASLWVGKVMGYPPGYGTPLHFKIVWGDIRMRYYSKQHWDSDHALNISPTTT